MSDTVGISIFVGMLILFVFSFCYAAANGYFSD